MDIKAFLNKYSQSLQGKTLVLTGASGGLGGELCRYLAPLGGKLILINHRPEKGQKLLQQLKTQNPQLDAQLISTDFQNIGAVKELCERLKEEKIDYLIHNAGAYYLPGQKSETGFDTVFQINFLSPYYITKELLPILEQRKAKVIITGSIAHGMVRALKEDADYSSCEMQEAVYGNSKRYLMYAHKELLKITSVKLAIAHPGISPTGITENYPELIRKITAPSMKLLFMPPKKACLSLLRAVFEDVPEMAWIGPEHLSIWGAPAIRALPECSYEERKFIFKTAEELYGKIKNFNEK